MDVEMVHFLAARGPLIDAYGKTVRAERTLDLIRDKAYDGEQGPHFDFGEVEKRRRMALGDDHRMARRPRVNIKKCNDIRIFVDDRSGQFMPRNPAKKTVHMGGE